MPIASRQTNKAAELMAALRALQMFTTGTIAICTDSQYVILGATGAARRWKLRGWKGSSGPVSNVALWEALLLELDRPGRTIHWVKVPSHVHKDGNNEADKLAEQGRMSHPKFPKLCTPAVNLLRYNIPKAPKRRKLISLSIHHQSQPHCTPPPPLPSQSAGALDMLSALGLEPLSEQGSDSEDTRSISTSDMSGSGTQDRLSTGSRQQAAANSCCSCSTDCSCH